MKIVRFKFIILTLWLACSSFLTYASNLEQPQVLNATVNLNDSASVYKALYQNTPIEPVFKLVPRFAIVGLDNKFVFSIGSTMRFTASYDWNNPVTNPLAMGLGSLKHSLSTDHQLFQMAAGGSAIYFNIIGFPNTANEIGLFISVLLDADQNNTYRLAASQAYMRYCDFQLGYSTSLYNDRGADAFTIDASGPCASGAYNTVGMNWQHYFNSHLHVGLGVELPKAAYTQIDIKSQEEFSNEFMSSLDSYQYTPNFPFYIGYVWNKGHIRLSGLIKNVHYVNLTNGKSENCIGNGLKITGNAKVGAFDLYWMGQLGWANSINFKGNIGSKLDLVPDDRHLGKLRPTHNWGFIVAAQWNITKKDFITVQHSYIRNYIPYYSVPAQTSFDDQMRYGNTFTINAVRRLTTLFSTGIEYRFVNKMYESGDKISNNRIYAMLLMTF